MVSVVRLADGQPVLITRHAIDAYMARYQTTLAGHAWRALRAAISSPRTRLESVTPADQSRHFKPIHTYITEDGMKLIVAIEPPAPKLLTIYYAPHLALPDMQSA
jgi:hypothetical protein